MITHILTIFATACLFAAAILAVFDHVATALPF
jgi:hypothetical protein